MSIKVSLLVALFHNIGYLECGTCNPLCIPTWDNSSIQPK